MRWIRISRSISTGTYIILKSVLVTALTEIAVSRGRWYWFGYECWHQFSIMLCWNVCQDGSHLLEMLLLQGTPFLPCLKGHDGWTHQLTSYFKPTTPQLGTPMAKTQRHCLWVQAMAPAALITLPSLGDTLPARNWICLEQSHIALGP